MYKVFILTGLTTTGFLRNFLSSRQKKCYQCILIFVEMIHVSVNLPRFIVNVRHSNHHYHNNNNNHNLDRQRLTVSGHVAISIYRVNLAFVNLQMMVLPVQIKVVIPGITFAARFLLMDPYVARRILNMIIKLKYLPMSLFFLLKFFS